MCVSVVVVHRTPILLHRRKSSLTPLCSMEWFQWKRPPLLLGFNNFLVGFSVRRSSATTAVDKEVFLWEGRYMWGIEGIWYGIECIGRCCLLSFCERKDVKGQWNSCVYFVVAIQIQLTLRIIDVIFHTLGGKRSEMHRRMTSPNQQAKRNGLKSCG